MTRLPAHVTVAVVIVAGGRGTRAAGASEAPKQYVPLGGTPVVRRAIDVFCAPGLADWIVAVVHPGDRSLFTASAGASPLLVATVDGGTTRQQSVRLGLEALVALAPDTVLIHDAARPSVSRPVIERVLAAISPGVGAIAAVAVADTLKRMTLRGS